MRSAALVTLEMLAAPSPNAMATGPFGSSIGTKTFRESGVPVIRGSNLSAEVGTRLIDERLVFIDPELADQFHRSAVKEGDLVFTCWGTVNQVGLIDKRARYDRYIVSNKQMKLTPDAEKVIPLYLYYWFSSPFGQADIRSISIGSSVPGFNLGQLRKMKVLLPSMEEQRGIVSILGSLDDKVDLNRRTNATLHAMARAIFKDWFVEFGPTRAKVEGRAPYLSPDVWALFPGRLNQEGKPEGWKVGRLDDLLVLQRGFDLPSDQRQSGEYAVVAASGPNGYHSQFRVKGPGVTTGRSGILGNVFFIHEDFWPLNTSLWVKEFKLSTPVHAYFLLQELDVGGFNSGSAVPTLNRNHVHNLPVMLPAREIIAHFDDLAMPLFRQMRANERENNTLVSIRDSLLPKLLSGEIRVKDAERIMEEVA